MNLTKISNKEIVFRINKLTKTERKITHLILWHINEFETRQLYAEMGFSSTFDYLVKKCGYSGSSAMRRLQAARLLKQVPEVSEKIETGSLNLTQLSQVQSALKQERKELKETFGSSQFDLKPKAKEVLAKLENKSQRQTELILAQEFNIPLKIDEKVRMQKDESLRLELTFSNEQKEILEQVKSLLSHQNPEDNWTDLFVLLAKKELKRRLGKMEETKMIETNTSKISSDGTKTSANENNVSNHLDKTDETSPQHKAAPERQSILPKQQPNNFKSQRKYISIHLKRDLFKKAKYQCQYIDPLSKQKCSSKHFLEIEHKIPLARGGNDQQQNLRIYCRTHNAYSAKLWGF